MRLGRHLKNFYHPEIFLLRRDSLTGDDVKKERAWLKWFSSGIMVMAPFRQPPLTSDLSRYIDPFIPCSTLSNTFPTNHSPFIVSF